MIRAVQSTIEGTTCELHVDGEQGEANMADGTAQGSTLGPTLCNLFFLPMLALWETEHRKRQHPEILLPCDNSDDKLKVPVHMHNFADDTLLITTSRAEAERAVKEFTKHLEAFQMRVHKGTTANPKSKSMIAHFYSTLDEKEEADHSPVCTAEDKSEFVNFATETVYLGALIHYPRRSP
jgi:hypothetical protein